MTERPGYKALHESAAWIAQSDRMTIRVSGKDRVRFLNGMLTANVEELSRERYLDAVKTSNKGKVEGLVRLRYESESSLFIDLDEAAAERVATELVRFIVMDEVELADATQERFCARLVGPQAEQALASTSWGVPKFKHCTQGECTIVRDDAFGPMSFEIFGPEQVIRAALQTLPEAQPQDFEVFRIERGVIKDGVDVDETVIALEASLEDRIDLTKGCYLGQEVLARATHRGGVRHQLVGWTMPKEIEASDALALLPTYEGKTVGRVTSAVWSPQFEAVVGLGYLRKEHAKPGASFQIEANEPLVVRELPTAVVG